MASGLLNQWRGQKPTYTFYPWEGRGERGGENYYVINQGAPFAPQGGEKVAAKPPGMRGA
jgi:hypothetical protein